MNTLMFLKTLLYTAVKIPIECVISMCDLEYLVFKICEVFKFHRRIKKRFFHQIKQTFIDDLFYNAEGSFTHFLLVVE